MVLILLITIIITIALILYYYLKHLNKQLDKEKYQNDFDDQLCSTHHYKKMFI